METLTIKGVHIGAGRPKTIVSLMDATADALLARARRAVAAGADCLEWRADFTRDAHDPAVMARIARELGAALPATPLIFTFRSAGQGGQKDLSPDAYAALNRAVLASGGIDLIDVETAIGDERVLSLTRAAHEQGVRTIVSHHDFSAMPPTDWMADELTRMATLGADICKLAVMAHSAHDALRLMEATAQARERLELPLLTMAMGPDGALSRLAGEAFGSALTFCALGTPSAPGQPSLSQATDALDALHRALAPRGGE